MRKIVAMCLGAMSPQDEVMEPIAKKFGPTAVYSKSNRAAGPLCEGAFALALGGFEEGGTCASRTNSPPNAPTAKPDTRSELQVH